MKRWIALVLCMVMLSGCIGCGEQTETAGSTALPAHVNELGNEYGCIDDMPDWTGEKLDLTIWYGHGATDAYIGKKSKDDKFRAELERVTGVTFNAQKSFDNGGASGDTKVARMVTTKSYPHIGIGVEASIIDNFISSDKLYDLTELIPKYMTNYMKVINSHEEIKAQYERKTQQGKHYTYVGFSQDTFKFYDPEYTAEKYANLIQPTDSKAWIWVRDDILTAIYPEAKTQKEIQQIYLDNGSFTKEDLTDVTIKSKEEFRALLEKINALNLTEDGRKVWPFYTHVEDNWDLMTMLTPPLAGKGIPDSLLSCFTYYDGETDEMANTMAQPWFKEMMQFYNQLIIDGLASKEALIDNRATFEQKKLNGEYAVIYGNCVPPTDEQLQNNGKSFSYRRVMIDVPCDYNKYVRSDTRNDVFAGLATCIFNTELTETQVEQFLRFLDFFYSEAGMKFANWGPKKAGLYTEDENGNMKYTDERFANAQLYNGDTEVLCDYGVLSFPRIDYFLKGDGINKYQPELVYADYEEERVASDYKKHWNYGYFEQVPDFPKMKFHWYIWSFPQYSNGVKQFWNARQTIEDAMKTVFTAINDTEFEAYYQKLLQTAEQNGLDEECIKEMTDILKKQNGEIYESLENWEDK